MVSHKQLKDNSTGARMVMITSSGNILNTFDGNDYMPCDDIIHGNYNVVAPPPPKEPPDTDKTDAQIITESGLSDYTILNLILPMLLVVKFINGDDDGRRRSTQDAPPPQCPSRVRDNG